MKLTKPILTATVAAFMLGGCYNQPGLVQDESYDRTKTGAATGALAGAMIGYNTGSRNATSAIVGGLLGAAAGGAIGYSMDNQATIDAIKRLANVGITARDAFDNFTKASARMRESMPSTKDWINYFNKRNNIMTNVEFLDIDHCSVLGDIRQRMNAEDENDTSFDDEINALTPPGTC